jgi:hypothetical protein
MVYMAGDNGRIFDDDGQVMPDLERFGWSNIADMARVGSSAEVAVVAQYDTFDAKHTPRFYLDRSSMVGKVVDRISPVNTGDPQNLVDFIVWAENSYPALRYALVLWSHGSGWKQDDVYARYRELERIKDRDQQRSIDPRRKVLRESIFLPTAAAIMGLEDDDMRALCYDDSSLDFLDNRDLVDALAAAEKKTGKRLALLGMDACLMGMIEVGYQVREYADILVASQEAEPATSWPYEPIVQALVDGPKMTARELGKVIVEAYGHCYLTHLQGGGGNATLSAIDLARIECTSQHVDDLARDLVASYGRSWGVKLALSNAREGAQRFRDPDYIDLYQFADRLWLDGPEGSSTVSIAEKLLRHLDVQSPQTPIVANTYGAQRPGAHGLSIYFPDKGCSKYYDPQYLAFARLGWRAWLYHVNGVCVESPEKPNQIKTSNALLATVEQ